MNNSEKSPLETGILIDFSNESELAYWAGKLNVRKEVIKTAARACCSNVLSEIKAYLKKNKALKPRYRRPLL